jgi:transcriptional regulator with XRE-family HTH domain
MDINEIGQLLKTARRKAGVTQAELADPLGMSRATISSLESGRCEEIGVTKLAALLDLVGLELTVRERRARPTIDDLRAEQRRR